MRNTWDNVGSAMVGIAALAVAAAFVHREFFPPPPPLGILPKSQFVEKWRDILPAGRLSGSPQAPITIVEFTDLQCPFCRRFNGALRAARSKYPDQISVLAVHYPLSGHQHARPAARAVECAATFNKAFEAIDFIFEAQDSLGRKPWVWFATGAGITDTMRFSRCMADTTARPLVTAGLAMGKKLGLHATPTIIMNGWRYGNTPSDTELVRAVGDLLAHRKPYKDFPASALGIRAAQQ